MYLFLEEIFFFIKMSQGPYPKAELSRPFEGPVAAAELSGRRGVCNLAFGVSGCRRRVQMRENRPAAT